MTTAAVDLANEPLRVIRRELPPRAFQVWDYLRRAGHLRGRHADWAMVPRATVARWCRVSERTVSRAYALLRAHNLLVVKPPPKVETAPGKWRTLPGEFNRFRSLWRRPAAPIYQGDTRGTSPTSWVWGRGPKGAAGIQKSTEKSRAAAHEAVRAAQAAGLWPDPFTDPRNPNRVIPTTERTRQ